jgi:hypothetical protein
MFLSELLTASLNKLKKGIKLPETMKIKKPTGIIPVLQHYVLEAHKGVKVLLYDS